MSLLLSLLLLTVSPDGNYLAAPMPIVHTETRQVEQVWSEPVEMELTAYVCEDIPCISASGVRAHVGMVAATGLPMGQRLRIEGMEGEFVVGDRGMLTNWQLDVFMESRDEAIQFGRQKQLVWLIGE